MFKYISQNETDTINFACKLASFLQSGDIIILSGDLGSGKTKFTQGILKFFSLDKEISSPTFTIVNEYNAPNNINIYHFDVYRLADIDEFYALGGDEYFDNGICIIEWGELIESILPKNYLRIPDDLLVSTMKIFNDVEFDRNNGDIFGKVYEFFLGKFASSEGQKGGEFYTPTCLVKLLVEIMKPFHGNVYDPACGSGGMFVQTAEFAKRENKDSDKSVNDLITVEGQEKTEETVRWCKMNLAVHGLEGDVKQANSFYEDVFDSVGKYNFVLANPPFNVDGVDKERLKGDKRFPFGLPKVDNANYLWIQMFYSALKKPKDGENSRAGFVMPNSASDARQTEQTIREKIIKDNAVDVMVSVGSNMFHNVTLPCTLWFLDKGKKNTDRKDKVLFLDVREIYTQIDRAHREFTDEQIEFITNIVKLYRGEVPEYKWGSKKLTLEHFPDEKYKDIKGLCKVATITDIEKQGWSLNAGRYVGVKEVEEEDYIFEEKLQELNSELEKLNSESKDLEEKIAHNIKQLLGV